MISVTELRKVVSDFVSGSIDRKVFTKRFAEMFYNIEKCGDAAAIEFANSVEARLVEAISGLISEAGLRACLSLLSVQVNISSGFRAELDVRVKQESSSPYEFANMTCSV